MPLPICDAALPIELVDLVAEFGRRWAACHTRPRPTAAASSHWAALIDEWIAAEDLPLLIRKHKDNRGSEVLHSTGRRLIPTDNSPAHWAFTLACDGITPTIDDIRSWFASDKVPVVMIQKGVEKPIAKYHCSLKREFNVNESGWKLAHIVPVGLNNRQSLRELTISRLVASFRTLLNPTNMFVVPLAWSGLAEVQVVIHAIRAHDEQHLQQAASGVLPDGGRSSESDSCNVGA